MAIDPGTEALLAAAAHWRDRCLLGEGSVFTEERLWTREHLGEMNRYFVENLDTGTGTFLEKLQAQLAPASPGTKRLAAEMLWLLLLFPNNISRDTRSTRSPWCGSGPASPFRASIQWSRHRWPAAWGAAAWRSTTCAGPNWRSWWS